MGCHDLPPNCAELVRRLSGESVPRGQTVDLSCMKKIGLLSFGHWTPSPQSETRSAADALLQSIDLTVEAERLRMDGAYFRVHHFAATGITVPTARGGRCQNAKD